MLVKVLSLGNKFNQEYGCFIRDRQALRQNFNKIRTASLQHLSSQDSQRKFYNSFEHPLADYIKKAILLSSDGHGTALISLIHKELPQINMWRTQVFPEIKLAFHRIFSIVLPPPHLRWTHSLFGCPIRNFPKWQLSTACAKQYPFYSQYYTNCNHLSNLYSVFIQIIPHLQLYTHFLFNWDPTYKFYPFYTPIFVTSVRKKNVSSVMGQGE